MVKVRNRISLNYRNIQGYGLTDIKYNVQRIEKESNFSQVVLEGVNEIARHQRREAPIGRQGSIPPSIRAGRVTKRGNTWTGFTWTTLKQAIFTNEGTATHIGGKEYPIKFRNKSGREITVMHPGIRSQYWWERGADKAKGLAFRSFANKVQSIMRVRFK